jgi:LmbE family N-acetylglucosaminyl deacetylase
MELGTVLGVWAHPDDETYLSAGLMATAVRNGDRVVCATATRGELGSFDEERWPTATLGRVRQEELEECLRILGVKEHSWFDYADGGCDRVEFEEGVAKVIPLIEDAQPDTVLTFGPDGMTGHTDHISVCNWTTEAFRRVAKPGARLHYATQVKDWTDRFYDRMQKFNVFMVPGTPPITPRDELSIDFLASGEVLDLKLKAIEAHCSQVEGMLKFFGEDFFREAMPGEVYRLAEVKS